jgi:hypothetical protein
MKQAFFTDRESGPRARTIEIIDKPVWGGIYALLSRRLADNSFGQRFPAVCPDGYGVCGYDGAMLQLTLAAEIPQIEWPLSPEVVPETPVILDLLEFAAASVGKPIEGYYHSFFRHHHLDFERDEGLARFVADVNFIFARNGLAFDLTCDGLVERIVPEALREALAGSLFRTGDVETDRLLHNARRQFTSPHLDARRDALEKLWDAFERLKTLEPGSDKRARANALLDQAASATRFRTLLGEEAKALTEIGNSFRIRHSETTQEILSASEQIDYLFHRMFAFVRLLLKATARGG